MTQIEALLALVGAYAEATGLSDATVSSRLFDDGKKVAALRAGKGITVTRLEAAVAWLRAHWPPDAAWPDDVGWPAPATGKAEGAPR
jgi:aminoglycoside phosphotransferase (APT) family kinase protein